MGEIYRTNNTLEFDDVDGIIIDERAPAPSVQGVPANTAILVGRFEKGPDSELIEPGSIGRLLEIYGSAMTSGRKQIVNKKFGRLKIIRAVASDSVKATLSHDSKLKFDAKYKGAYGNSLQVLIENASEDVATIPAVQQVEQIDFAGLTGADFDVDGDGLYIGLGEKAYIWLNVSDGSNTQTEPTLTGFDAGAGVTLLSADTADQIAQKIQTFVSGAGFAGIASSSKPSTGVLQTTLVAGDEVDGSAGDSGAAFTLVTDGADSIPGDDAGVKITITDTSTGALLLPEVYDNVKIAEITAATFGNSELVDVTVLDAGSGEPALLTATNLATGSDGTEADTDYQAAIAVAEQEQAGNIMWTDKMSATIKGYLKQHTLNAPDKMVVVSTDSPEDPIATALADVVNYRDTEGRIIYAFNGVQTRINGALEYTGAAGWVASIISNIAPQIDPAYAENIQYMLGATDIKNKMTRNQFIQLKEAGIAGFEFDRDLGGFKLRSGIVTQILNSSKVTILRRRMTDFLTESYAQFLKNYQNAPNTQAVRNEVKGQLLAFDDGLINDGVLPSNNEITEGDVRLYDTQSLNTANVLAAGFFKILIKRRIYSSMRFIVIQAEIGESVIVTEGDS